MFLIADVGKVFTHVTHASAPLLVAGMVLSLLTRLAAAERTYVVTRSAGLATTRLQTLAAMFIANFWSLLLPGSIGGGVATVLIYKAMGAAIEVVIAALTASRVAELAAYCALGTITLAWTPHMPASAQVVLVSIAVLTASAFRYVETVDAVARERISKDAWSKHRRESAQLRCADADVVRRHFAGRARCRLLCSQPFSAPWRVHPYWRSPGRLACAST